MGKQCSKRMIYPPSDFSRPFLCTRSCINICCAVTVPVVWQQQHEVGGIAESVEESSPPQDYYSSPYNEDEDSVMILNASQDSFENTKDEKMFGYEADVVHGF